jgi:opacity protein-like surface antigen
MMKKLLTILFFLSGTYAFAQYYPQQASTNPQPQPVPQKSSGPAVRLHGYTTYAFDDNSVDSYYSDTEYFEGEVKGGFQWGAGLEVMPAPTMGVEFTYLRLDSKAPLNYYNNGIQYSEFDVAHNYLFLSFNKYMPVNPKIEPFAGMQLGMGIYNVTNPDNDNSGSATKFAWGIRAGANIWANEKVGIKLQAGLLSAVQAFGGSVYFGTGGAGAGVSGFSTYWQFSLGGGLVFRLR